MVNFREEKKREKKKRERKKEKILLGSIFDYLLSLFLNHYSLLRYFGDEPVLLLTLQFADWRELTHVPKFDSFSFHHLTIRKGKKVQIQKFKKKKRRKKKKNLAS